MDSKVKTQFSSSFYSSPTTDVDELGVFCLGANNVRREFYRDFFIQELYLTRREVLLNITIKHTTDTSGESFLASMFP